MKTKFYSACFLAALLFAVDIHAQVSGPVTIGPDEYAFQYNPSPGIGLFFSAADSRYELRDSGASPAWWLNPQADRAYYRGRVGIGTETPSVALQVAGASRFGIAPDFANFNSVGDLTFAGSSDFLVGNDRYAFRAQANENYGLLFNATENQYQFIGGSATPVLGVDADGGNLVAYDENGDAMLSHDGNNLTVSSLGVSSGVTLEGSNLTTQVRVRLNNNMPGGKNWILQSTAAGTPVGGGKFSIRNEETATNALVIDSNGNVEIDGRVSASRMESSSSITVGNNLSGGPFLDAGMIRWNGSDFEGYNGISWKSFTQAGNEVWFDAPITDFTYRTGTVSIGTSSSFPNVHMLVRGDSASNPLRVQVGTATKFYVTNTGGVSVGSSYATPPSNGMYVNGDVAIGTQTPATGYKVSVNGKVICEELAVEMSGDWPDYVFAPQYQLPALPELKQTIQELGHLPGVPSATEVADGGLLVGEMQATLLEKVEELTLYIIELEERLADMESDRADKR